MSYTIIYYSPHPTHDIVSEVGYATHQRETILALESLGHKVVRVIMGGTEVHELIYTKGTATTHIGFKGLIKKFIPKFIWVTLKDIKLQFHDKKAAKKLKEAIINHRPDFIYERSEILQSRSVNVIKRFNIPYLLEVNAPFVEEMFVLEGFSLMHFFAKRMEKKKMNLAKSVFVVSSSLKEYLISKYNIQMDKILVAPNRINVLNFNAEFIPKTKIQSFGFVGSILPFHKIDMLVEATAIVVREYPEIIGIIVGDGTQLDEIRKLCTKLGLDRNLQFVGRVPHKLVYKKIAEMDLCIMPGVNWYQSPVKIFEYGAMGKPIIGSNAGSLADIMEHQIDGLLIEQTAEALAKAIIFLIEHPTEASEMAFRFKKKVQTEYTWRHAAMEIIEAYEQ